MEDLTFHLLGDAGRGEECSGNGKSCSRREWRRDLGLALDEHSQGYSNKEPLAEREDERTLR